MEMELGKGKGDDMQTEQGQTYGQGVKQYPSKKELEVHLRAIFQFDCLNIYVYIKNCLPAGLLHCHIHWETKSFCDIHE
jgi:hypothetical protein